MEIVAESDTYQCVEMVTIRHRYYQGNEKVLTLVKLFMASITPSL